MQHMSQENACRKCKLSALCVPAGGVVGLADRMWRCRDCGRLFLLGVLGAPLALPDKCKVAAYLCVDEQHKGVCEECFKRLKMAVKGRMTASVAS